MTKEFELKIDNRGTKWYYLNDKLHREDGPAIEYENGQKEWWLNNLCHREDGPAVESPNGDKEWWKNDLRHRADGPAVEYANGVKEWYYEGKYIKCSSQEEFEKIIRLRAFW